MNITESKSIYGADMPVLIKLCKQLPAWWCNGLWRLFCNNLQDARGSKPVRGASMTR